jgi:hypothetical protein
MAKEQTLAQMLKNQIRRKRAQLRKQNNRHVVSRGGRITRRSKWNNKRYVPLIRAAILAHRQDGMVYDKLVETFRIPTRTLRRYISDSRNPNSGFYLAPTEREIAEKNPDLAISNIAATAESNDRVFEIDLTLIVF